MEGELGGFGGCAGQDQQESRRRQGMPLDAPRLGDPLADLEGAGDIAQQGETRQHGQSAGAGDQQRLPGGGAGVGLVMLKTDQEEGGDGGQLPGDEQQQGVLAQHHAQHGGHEQDHQAVEAPQEGVPVQVGAPIDDHQRADARDEQRHDQPQPVQAERQAQAQAGHPGQRKLPGLAGGDGGDGQAELQEDG